MAQCHGYFLLTSLPPRPCFLLLTAGWSQGRIRSSGWEGDARTEFSAMLSQRYRCKGGSGFIPVQSRQQGCPRDWGSWRGAQQALRAAKFKDRYTQAQLLQGQEGRGQSCLQGLGRHTANNALYYISLAGNVPGTSL